MRQCAASFAAALLLHTAPVCAAEVVQGPARAVDGDTLVVGIFVLLADQPRKGYAHQHSMWTASMPYDCPFSSVGHETLTKDHYLAQTTAQGSALPLLC